ncbi:TPA: hypothetical protein L3955_000308 [Pseudomonas aeruginosa]|nr:hypothetical protein [Pseudomonas aeruginosa]
MNNRELLELAARAAGYKLIWSYDNHCCWINEMRHDLDVTWNPLTDDGDALRLAVKRGFVVTPDRENQRTMVSNQAGHEYCAIYWDKLGEMAATRLAITEAAAAAEIGKSMGGGE